MTVEKSVTDPPFHLSRESRKLWRAIVPRRARSPERLILVRAALEALDRAEAARTLIAMEGMTTTTKTTGAVHIHPLVRVEREARSQFMRAWDQLNLAWDARTDGRT